MRRGVVWLAAIACVGLTGSLGIAEEPTTPDTEDDHPTLSPSQRREAATLSPLPPVPDDVTNAVADSPAAATFGRWLFFDRGLSRNGEVSCASCHLPDQGLADGRPLGEGLGTLSRHTPTLWNVAYQRWLFWDGRADSLWAQALQPLEHPDEMGSHRLRVARRIQDRPELADAYRDAFGDLPPLDPGVALEEPGTIEADQSAFDALSEDQRRAVQQVYVNVGKAIAAYERRLISDDSPFDRFIRDLPINDEPLPTTLSASAIRGLALFIGDADCTRCHHGPNFTDGEFHDTRIPPRQGGAPKDSGRYGGVPKVLADPFNSQGDYSDAPAGTRNPLRFLRNGPENWGRFRTPTLRNVARTAPYFHQGQKATLREVVEYYSTLEGSLPPDHDPEAALLQPLDLKEDQINDLVAFLETLTDESIDAELLTDPWTARDGR